MSLPIQLGATSGSPSGYNIQRSLRFRSSASAYLSRTPASASNRTTWTWSGWVKRGALGTTTGMAYQQLFGACPASGSDATFTELVLNGNDTLQVGGWTTTWKVTTQVFRDTSAWYHFVWVLDTGNATAADRMRLYVNGSRITSFSTSNDPSLNATLGVNNNVAHALGSEQPYSSRYFDGYLAEVNFIDGQALTPSSFGQTDATTGVWVPKRYVGTYGTNGFYLPFSDNTSATTLAYDKSGNGNNWTPNNISTTNDYTYASMTDVPTLTSATAANYCVLNPLKATKAPTNGNLDFYGASGSYTDSIYGTIGVTGSGKYYFEVGAAFIVGVNSSDINPATDQSAGRIVYHTQNGAIYSGTTTLQSGLATATFTDVIGIALNLDAGTLAFYKNNVQLGTNVSISAANTWWPFLQNTTSWTNNANFGQRPFSYTPPTGFKALNTFNLPDPTIKKPNQYMDATTYTGTGGSQTVANAAGFAPDLVWLKMRNLAGDNYVWDSVRGGGSALDLVTDRNAAEGFNSAYHNLAFASNGFTVTQIAPGNEVNYSGNSYIGWQWKKGATPGFDIVTYTGTGVAQNISHNLGVAPKMIIVKARSGTSDWSVYTATTGAGNYVLLNTTGASAASSTKWNNAAPTSSVFSVGIDTTTNMATVTYVAYLFAEIPGFSKFGSYTGNGSTDGPFVYCGFRPKYILIKNTVTAGSPWNIYDATRSPYNVVGNLLLPNASDAEYAQPPYMDFLSNGVKMRGTGAGQTGANYNGNTETYIYAAFAENPMKYSLAR